jgi:DNA-binding CsgD family transcriptional regulator
MNSNNNKIRQDDERAQIENQEIPSEARVAFSQEVKTTVIPLLQKLKEVSTKNPNETFQLINALESNLQHAVDVYGYGNNLTATYRHLTPVETLVASMIRQGLSTLLIAESLHISPGTVSIHRKHIRKKLGLQRMSANLQSHLQSLTE